MAAVVAPDGLVRSSIYEVLRQRIVTGRMAPGSTLSTRSVALELGTSQMPVREALGRLAAEGAVEIRSKRRIVVPRMTVQRFEDLLRCRELLEPEAAVAALDYIDAACLARLELIDEAIGIALANNDVDRYMQENYNFHFTIYRSSPCSTMSQLIETLWLQFGPYMRVVYDSMHTVLLVDQHQLAVSALRAKDAEKLRGAIRADIRDGMGLIGVNSFGTGS